MSSCDKAPRVVRKLDVNKYREAIKWLPNEIKKRGLVISNGFYFNLANQIDADNPWHIYEELCLMKKNEPYNINWENIKDYKTNLEDIEKRIEVIKQFMKTYTDIIHNPEYDKLSAYIEKEEEEKLSIQVILDAIENTRKAYYDVLE